MLTPKQRTLILTAQATGISVKTLGLRGRGEVFIFDTCCVRLIDRSSRFLRKDAETFIEVLRAASAHQGRSLKGHIIVRRAPICSKALTWLTAQGVTMESIGDA